MLYASQEKFNLNKWVILQAHVAFLNSFSVVWSENISCVFKVNLPFSNSSVVTFERTHALFEESQIVCHDETWLNPKGNLPSDRKYASDILDIR